MDFKKFKHDLQKENLVIPSMSDKLKNYSKQEIVYKEKKEKVKISFAPLFRYSYLLVPILIMLLTVTIASIAHSSSSYRYELYSVKNKQNLHEILNVGDDFEMGGFDIGFIGGGDIMEGPTNSAPNWDSSEKNDGISGKPGDSNNNPDYSDTNKQEQGVDEADIVKTDGYNIYYVNKKKCTLYYYNVTTKGVSKVPINDASNSLLYINDNYLILLQYGVKYSGRSSLVVNVYDKETLEIVKNYSGQGAYIDSRLTNNVMYLVYVQHIIEQPPCDIIDFEENIYEYNDIKYSPATINQSITFIVAIDLNSLETNVHLQLGAYTWQAVYMTENNLYLASSNYCSSFRNYTLIGSRFTSSLYQTNILSFKLNGANIEYKGIIITSGLIKNQFHLDEYDNHLRVVLQQQNTKETGNNKLEIYSLEKYQEDGIFKKVASIDDGIGKTGEQIKSVRFSDNSCLIVTYLQTDPLYYIDLTDQLKPQIIAGYEEPGYNTYLHYINDKLAIGFGVLDRGYVEDDHYLVSSNYKVGLYDISFGVPNKLSEVITYDYISVADNHKALYIEGEIFGFSAITLYYRKSDGMSRVESVYDIYTISYENDVPQLKLLKQFVYNFQDSYRNCYYERMIRIDEEYYLISQNYIEILNNNFEDQKKVLLD